MATETLDEPSVEQRGEPGARPALLLVWSAEGPQQIVLPLLDGVLELGRDELAAVGVTDASTSRRHARIELAKDRWSVCDLGSRNGTFVDGRRISAVRDELAPVVRIGRTLLLTIADAGRHEPFGITCRDGMVMGPALRALHERIAAAARSGAQLLLQAEPGCGKELAVQTFNAAAAAGRPLVAVNCATLPKERAERVLFGARLGAIAGPDSDVPGLLLAADGGTLFLDEIGELDLDVQAKLVRAIEQQQVTPLGAGSPVAVRLRLFAATREDLRAAVLAGRFREDLYLRLSSLLLRIPPLRERREEIPWLIARALAAAPTATAGARHHASAEFVEACLLRSWPNNVRELLTETGLSVLTATAAGRSTLWASDLDAEAGRALDEDGQETTPPVDEPIATTPSADDMETALRGEQGNIARAAARLGMSRGRLRRFIDRRGIDVNAFLEG